MAEGFNVPSSEKVSFLRPRGGGWRRGSGLECVGALRRWGARFRMGSVGACFVSQEVRKVCSLQAAFLGERFQKKGSGHVRCYLLPMPCPTLGYSWVIPGLVSKVR